MEKIDFIVNYFSGFNYGSVILRLFMATILGGFIGLDRGLKKRPAGLRTFALVSVGSAIAMVTNEYLYYKFNGGLDVARMAAQVISGVGFLGAGTIIVTGRQRVKGLTTAASLWATAAMGIAIGAGFFIGAFIGFLCIVSAMIILHNLDNRLNKNSKLIEIYVEASSNSAISALLAYIKSKNFSISSLEKNKGALKDNDLSLMLELNLKKRMEHDEIISQIAMIEGIFFVEEIK